MLALNARLRVWVAAEPADFRCGIDGLARRVRQKLAQDPFSGGVFVFCNRRRTAVKLLVDDGQGFWLCQKRLSQGHYRFWPQESPGKLLAAHALAVLLAGRDYGLRVRQAGGAADGSSAPRRLRAAAPPRSVAAWTTAIARSVPRSGCGGLRPARWRTAMSRQRASHRKRPARNPPQRMVIPVQEIESIVEQSRARPLTETEQATLKAAVDTLARITAELETKETTLARLRRILFGAPTERTANVLGEGEKGETPPADTPTRPSAEGGDEQAAGQASADTTSPEPGGAEPRKKRPGHGRNGAANYPRAQHLAVPQATLRHGDLFMTLIHTAELHQIEPFHYLVSLLRHSTNGALDPAAWMPWNYTEALARAEAQSTGPPPD